MRSRPVKVLHVVNGLAIGGAERKVLDLTRRLHGNGLSFAVCSVGQGGPLQAEFEKLGVPVWILRKKFAFDASLILKTAEIIRAWKPDVVQTTLLYADIIGTLAARWVGLDRVISWETVSHGEQDILRTRFRHVVGYRACMKGVRRIVAVSGEIRESLVKRRYIDPRKVVVIPYGVDVQTFRPAQDKQEQRRRLGLPEQGLLIGTVARLEPYKGYLVLLEAARVLLERHPQLHFVWVGDGSLRPAVEDAVQKSPLRGKLHLLGFREDVNYLLPAFDLFVLPSLSEGLPNAVLEAMACGLPCVASRVGGIPEVLSDGETGILVKPGDVRELVEGIERYVTNEEGRARAGQNARMKVEREYSVDREMASFRSLYYELLNGK